MNENGSQRVYELEQVLKNQKESRTANGGAGRGQCGSQQEGQWGANKKANRRDNGKDDNRMDSRMKEKKPVYFTSERVSAHVTRIRGAISEYMYLVEGEDRALLIDAGCGVGNIAAYVGTLTALPLTVVLTHGHYDHCGGMYRFDEVYLNREERIPTAIHYTEEKGAGIAKEHGFSDDPEAVTRIRDIRMLDLEDGRVFELGGGVDVEAICCPGHTVATMAMLIRPDRLLLTGDACHWITYLHFESGLTVERFRKSLVKLQTRESEWDSLLLSHPVDEAPKSLIPEMIGRCDQLLSRKTEGLVFEKFDDTCLHYVAKKDGELANLLFDIRKVQEPKKTTQVKDGVPYEDTFAAAGLFAACASGKRSEEAGNADENRSEEAGNASGKKPEEAAGADENRPEEAADASGKRLEEIWQTMFYGPEDERIYHPVGEDMGYIEDTGNHDARTEGMSYGMMACVQLDHKEEFDRIWKWTVTYMYMEEGENAGYFAWSCQPDGTKNSMGPAPDGEEYFAMALFFASHRWGDGEGVFAYSSWAKKILQACIYHGAPANKAMWNRDNHLILFVPGCPFTDPSYHLPHFYELFALWDEENREFWQKAAAASREYLQKACDPVTGLCAEYAEFDGTPHLRTQAEIEGGNPYRHDWFYSDAYRTAGNVSLDARWFGADAWKESELAAYQKFFLEHEPVFGIYEKDGRVIEGQALHPVGLLATIAECSLVTIHSGDETTASNGRFWLEKFWNTPLRKGERRYYDNFLYLFAFLALSGEYRIY